MKATWGKFGIEVWPRAGKVKKRSEIVEFTGLELEDEGGFPVNIPDCQVLDQSVNHTWKNLKGGLNAKFQKRKPSRRTNGGFVNDVLSSWEEMKIEHIPNAIDAQRGVMLEIIEKQGVLLRFSVPTRHVKLERGESNFRVCLQRKTNFCSKNFIQNLTE